MKSQKNLAQQTEDILEILESGFPAHRLELIWNNRAAILEWIHSDTFKQKYSKHPYPPLVNPETITYEGTDPSVAWDFNLPLPPYYTMLISIMPGAGGTAFERFLSLCEVDCYSKWYGHTLAYLENYKLFLQSKGAKALILTDFVREDTKKFWSLINSDLPLIALVRDPILVLKCLVNHTRPIEQNPLAKEFDLTCSYASIKPQIAYHCSNNKPNLEAVIQDCINGLYRSIFCFAWKLAVIAPKEVIYIDGEEINAENAFKTFETLSQKFGFNPPKQEDRERFSKKANKNTGLLSHLPCVLHASIDKSGIPMRGAGKFVADITITTQLEFDKQMIDCTNLLMPNIYNTNIVLSTDKSGLESLKKSKKLQNATKKFLEGYFNMIKEMDVETKENLITPKQVLEYLKTHKTQCEQIKNIFDEELAHIKKHRLDIVESWSYYQEFIKITGKSMQKAKMANL